MTKVPVVNAFDQASLESFTSQLVAAGFEPDPGTALRSWTGPAHGVLAPLTDARRMRIVIRDGWPVVFPYLFAEGLNTNHLTSDGYVCLWHEGEGSREWVTLDGIHDRLSEWCDAAQNGWDPAGLAQDAYLNFQPKARVVAILDLDVLQLGAGGTRGRFRGKFEHPGRVVLQPDGQQGELKGVWYSVSQLEVAPRNLTELRQVLARQHARSLDRALEARRDCAPLQPSGSVDLMLLLWHLDKVSHVLVLALEGTGDQTTALALQVGPNDMRSLVLRAGSDATLLAGKTVTVFGLGALGGHVALALAQSGVTQLRLFDRDLLLPENVVRHVGGQHLVGAAKSDAVAAIIRDSAPWTEVCPTVSSPVAPDELNQALSDSDLVVDTTGVEAATQAICLCTLSQSTALVSGALYRGGSVVRVRRQGTPGDTPILDRALKPGYVLIPPGTDDHLVHPAIGCSGPVHNAPPTAVLAAAALVAQMAVDVLTSRLLLPEEVIDVYRPLPDQPPFDQVGRLPHDEPTPSNVELLRQRRRTKTVR